MPLRSSLVRASLWGSAISASVGISQAPDAPVSTRDLRMPPQFPLLYNLTANTISDAAANYINNTIDLIDYLVSTIEVEDATFDTVFLPLIKFGMEAPLQRDVAILHVAPPPWCYLEALVTFHQDLDVRDASSKLVLALDDLDRSVKGTREDLFALVEHVAKNADKEEPPLDRESLRVVNSAYKNMLRAGMGLGNGPERDEYLALSAEISALIGKFVDVPDDMPGMWISPEQLDGLPDDEVATLQIGDVSNGNEGKVFLPLYDPGSYMRRISNNQTRMEILVTAHHRTFDRIPDGKRLIGLRDQVARILGYPNHEAFKTEINMAKDPETVGNFLASMKTNLATLGSEDMKTLKYLKENDLNHRNETFDDHFYTWDYDYYRQMLKEQTYNVNQTLVSEYYVRDEIVDKFLDIFSELFGLAFERLDTTALEMIADSMGGQVSDFVWDESLTMYTVWDTMKLSGDDDGFRGYLTFDLIPREGKDGFGSAIYLGQGFSYKSRGFAAMAGEDGNGGPKRQFPNVAIFYDTPPATDNHPALLTQNDVEILFHETGHAIHSFASRRTYKSQHAVSPDDFVETPSQALENWVWTPSVLKRITSHYDTGEPMPDGLIDNLVRTRNVLSGLVELSQTFLAAYDFKVHSPATHEEVEELDINDLWYDMMKEYWPDMSYPTDYDPVKYPNNSWGGDVMNFPHLWGYQYDGSYYGYQWSRVYAADIWDSKFKANPMNAEEGRRYRTMVLNETGFDETEMLTDYLGRAPSVDAFHRAIGIMS